MWVMTTKGFYSAVLDDGRDGDESKGMIVVRARVREDLAPLEANSLRGVEAIGGDYEFRVRVPRAVWEEFLASEAAAIDYPNFKSAVTKAQGWYRHDVYMSVWSVLWRGLRSKVKEPKQTGRFRRNGREVTWVREPDDSGYEVRGYWRGGQFVQGHRRGLR